MRAPRLWILLRNPSLRPPCVTGSRGIPRFAFLFLIGSLVLATDCADRPKIVPKGGQEAGWQLGPTTEYPVPSGSNVLVADSISGDEIHFPQGGSGTVRVERILSGPAAPYAGKEVSIEYAGNEELQLLVNPAGAARTMVLGFGQVDGAFNDSPATMDRWASVPQVDTVNGKIAYLLTMPFSLPEKRTSGGVAGILDPASTLSRPRGSNRYLIASIPAGSSRADTMRQIEAMAATDIDSLLTMLTPVRRAVAEPEVRGRLRLNFAYDGFYYDGFWWRSLGSMGRLVHPTVHYRLSANAGNIAHELGHYFTHVLVGDDTASALEGQAPLFNSGHGIRDVVGRQMLLEDYAYVSEYFLVGSVKGYDLVEPYVIFGHLTPLTTDFPGLEGFSAVTLASLVRTTDHIRDLITGLQVEAPVIGASRGEVYEIIAGRALGVEDLRARIETALGSRADKLPAVLQRCGWSYGIRGRYVAGDGTGVSGVTTTAVSRVGGRVYEGGYTVSASDANGRFSVTNGVFGGQSELRAVKGPDSAYVAIHVDWTNLTTNTVDVGNLVVDFPPVITRLSPPRGKAGDPVTIEGRNFGSLQGISTVSFNGTPASVTSWGDAAISVMVPQGARSGPVTVTCRGISSMGAAFFVTGTGRWVFLTVENHDEPLVFRGDMNLGEFQAGDSSFDQHCGFDNPNYPNPTSSDWETRVHGSWTVPPPVLVPGDTLRVTITISTEYVRVDNPPQRSQYSIGYIYIDAWEEQTPPILRGTGTQTTSHVVRGVLDPNSDRLGFQVNAGGFSIAGAVARRYLYRWEQ